MKKRYIVNVPVLLGAMILSSCGLTMKNNNIQDVPEIVEVGDSDIPTSVQALLNQGESVVSVGNVETKGISGTERIMCPYVTQISWRDMSLGDYIPEWDTSEELQAEEESDSGSYFWSVSQNDAQFQELILDVTQKNESWTDVDRDRFVSCLDGEWQKNDDNSGEFHQTNQDIPLFWYDVESPYQKDEIIYGTVLYVNCDGDQMSIYGANPKSFEESDIYVNRDDLLNMDEICQSITEYLEWETGLTDTDEVKNVYDWMIQSVELCYLPLPDGAGNQVLTPCWYVTVEEYSATFMKDGNVNYYHNDFLPVILLDAISGQIYDKNMISSEEVIG